LSRGCHERCLVKTSGDILAGMGLVWSTQVQMHFVFLLAWDGVGHLK
jgi:hypothetical protein